MTTSLHTDNRYAQALHHLQGGRWDEVTRLLADLQQDYPAAPEVERLAREVAFKANLAQTWGGSLTRRRLRVDPGRALRWTLALLIILALLFGATRLYRQLVIPQRQAMAVVGAVEQAMLRAGAAYEQGDYETALASYQQVITLDPENAAARWGALRATSALKLSSTYVAATTALDAGDATEAASLFQQVVTQAPGYRDAEAQLARLRASLDTAAVFAEAELVYSREQWAQAIPLYETLRSTDARFQQEAVEAHLFESYLQSSQDLLQSDDADAVETAGRQLRSALLLWPGEKAAAALNRQLLSYQEGVRQLDSGEIGAALALLVPIFEQNPGFLAGRLARQLFDAYLALGDQAAAAGERLQALDLYGKAARLPVADVDQARLRLEALAVGIPPTPTFTPTPTPTLTPIPSATVRPTATPQPPVPLAWHQGWIAFLSDRDGPTAVYVMRPDGSGQRPIRRQDREIYNQLAEQQQWSPDGTTQVYAEKGGKDEGDSINLFIFRHDLPDGWDRRFMYTDWGGTEYDPAWSPDNQYIAFVGTHTGNDEIWRMRSDGTEKEQLTQNSWEWDKHPTWSPDSQTIAFTSNRDGGNMQIWIMAVDGSGQQNISRNNYNDSNPVWIH